LGEKVAFCEDYSKLDGLNAKVVGDAAEAGISWLLKSTVYVDNTLVEVCPY
jgi:hypothetical protein